MKRRIISTFGGWFMNSKLSRIQIKRFVEQCQLDLSDFIITDHTEYLTFNDFFYRKIKPEKRPVGEGVVSPTDCRILAFQNLNDIKSFFIKGSKFTINSLVNDKALESKYINGSMVIARLAPTDYHRFHFPASGKPTISKQIKGKYFSVSPIALKKGLKIFFQNKREYSILETTNFGDILCCEIGATMVGTIIQTYQSDTEVKAGQEKGYFAFGGSTIVLLFENNKVTLSEDLIKNTQEGFETLVQMGETIGLNYK